MSATDAIQRLHDALPADPDDHGPVAVASDDIRTLDEHGTLLRRVVATPPEDNEAQ